MNKHHRTADIGFLIGEKSYWGHGIATEAIRLVTDFAFNILHLHKVWGGLYAPNLGSLRAFEKNGFSHDGVRKSHCILHTGDYCDCIYVGKINPNE